MNRPIKFRIWHKEYKQWAEMSWSVLNAPLIVNDIFEQKKYEFQQFTGLLDKFAREIYEGDIVKFARYKTESVEFAKNCFSTKSTELGNEVGEIIFIRPSFCLSFEHIRYDDIEPMPIAEGRYEIIGNKFENPELLKTNA